MLKIEKRRAYKARTVCQWCIIISLCMYTSRLMLLILGIKNNCTLPYFQSSLLSSMSNFFFFLVAVLQVKCRDVGSWQTSRWGSLTAKLLTVITASGKLQHTTAHTDRMGSPLNECFHICHVWEFSDKWQHALTFQVFYFKKIFWP